MARGDIKKTNGLTTPMKMARLFAGPWIIQCSFQCLVVILIGVLAISVIYRTKDNTTKFSKMDDFVRTGITDPKSNSFRPKEKDGVKFSKMDDFIRTGITDPKSNSFRPKPKEKDVVNVISVPECNLFDGKWVLDNNSYPLYKDDECTFMFDDLACQKYGRKDSSYQKWRWQPHNCDIPRFNGTELLERLRDKRLVFVGDSVNRNQWVSLICMVEGPIPREHKSLKFNQSLYSFIATEYNLKIEFYWAPLLVESNSDNPSNHSITNRIVKLDSIEKHAIHWHDADILIFNSYLWWDLPVLKVVEGSLEKPRKIKQVKNHICYQRALKTWSNWIKTNLNQTKTKMFFVSMPATHRQAYDWGKKKYNNCYNESEPISKVGYSGSGADPKMKSILESTLDNLKTQGLNVQMLNITQLSEYRKDGHPSIYRKLWRPLSKEKLSNPLFYSDCTHWCLPGVPDVWNQLLYAYLLRS